MAVAEGPSKRSFGIFSIMRKPKADPAARATPKTPPKLELHLPPPSPPPALVTDDNKGSEIPPPAAAARSKVTKKASTDVDDELRKHLQREGFAFLAFTDLDRVAAGRSTPPAAAAVAAGNGKPVEAGLVVDPVESSRRDGTLLRDAVERLDKAGLEASRVGHHPSPSPSPPPPPPLVPPPPHPRPQPALSKPGRRSPETSAPERIQPPPPASSLPPPQTQHKPSAPTKQKPDARALPAVSPTVSPTTTPTPRIDTGAGVPNKGRTPSTVTVVGDATDVRSTTSKRYGTVEPLAPTSRTPQPSTSSAESAVPTNGHLQAVDHNGSGGGSDRRVERKHSHRRTERGTWNKSPTDSGKDLRMDASQATSSSTEGSSSAPPPGRADAIPESSAMARFAQDASMHDLDPRRSGNHSNSNNSNQHPQPRRAPPPPEATGRRSRNSSSRHHYYPPPHPPAAYGPGGGGRGGRRPRSYETAEPPAAANFESNRRSPSPPVDEVKTRSDSSPETSPESPRTFSLPVPVMLPPDDYKTSPNELQRNCPQSHCWTVVSANVHHRICCMVCQLDSADERWLCSYCALRFCSRCKSEFSHGQTFDQIVAKAEAEDWKAQQQQQQPSSSSSSPARGAPERNIPWELACVMEAGGRLHGPAAVPRSSPPPWPRDYRRPPPPPSSRNRRGSPPGEQPYPYDYRSYDYRSYDHRYRHRSGKSSPHSSSYSPDRQYYDGIPSIQNHPPSSTESDQERRSRDSSRNGNRSKASSIYEDMPQAPSPVGHTDRRAKDARRRTPVSAEMVAPQAHKRCSLKGGAPSAAEQRRALLGGPY